MLSISLYMMHNGTTSALPLCFRVVLTFFSSWSVLEQFQTPDHEQFSKNPTSALGSFLIFLIFACCHEVHVAPRTVSNSPSL